MLLGELSWPSLLGYLQANPYVAGVVMLFVNAGTSFLLQDMAPALQTVFRHVWMRRLVLFAIFFTATRDIIIALVLTVVFALILDGFMNAESRFCLMPREHDQRRSRFRRNARVLLDR
jgi:hypothetical protein